MPAFSLSKLERLRVMLVDNSPMMRELVQSVLESVGVKHFMTASDGRSAIEMLPAFGPHLAFVDWEMVPMNGLDFVRAVRKLSERDNPFLPIIMLTSVNAAMGISIDRDDEMVPVEKFQSKPVEPATLVAQVNELLGL